MKMHLDQCTSRTNLHPRSLNEKKLLQLEKLLQTNQKEISNDVKN